MGATNVPSKTTEAWDSGIGHHFSTERYVDLAPWFDSYVSALAEQKPDNDTATQS